MNLIVLLFDGFWVFLIPLLAAFVGYVIGSAWRKKYYRKEIDITDSNEKHSLLEGEIEKLKEQNKTYRKKIKELEAKNEVAQDQVSDPEADSTPESIVDRSDSPEDQSIAPLRATRTSKFDALENDNLQIIEGIGPKMESVLKENGINNWALLATQTEDGLSSILAKYGKKYKIIDPSSWTDQASLAANGSWSSLVDMQKGIDAQRDPNNLMVTRAKVEKVMIKLGIIMEYKQDDLKAIEGIGPKIAKLLNTAGIISWNDLATTEGVILQNILDSAGKSYQFADPRTWPKQAALADEGKFDELRDYQEILQGGI